MQKLKTIREEEVGTRIPEGLKDGGHILLPCSNCRAILMDIWRTRPHENEVWKVKANCPFCGDKSFVTEVQGGFHPGGYGKTKEDDPEDDVPSTIIEDCDIEDQTFTFKIKKASENAKPYFR